MSIKSQKSLHEECSEIIERSYSVKSLSDESLSCDDDDDEALARELMIKLTPAVLSKLRRSFKKTRERTRGHDIDRRVEEVMRQAAAAEGINFSEPAAADDPLWQDEAGFVAALEQIFGHHKYTTHSHSLFRVLDPFTTGRVKWRHLIDRLVAVGARRTGTRKDGWAPVCEGRVERMEHCKRETVVKLVSIELSDSFCYVVVSKGGRVGVYSGLLDLVHSYEVFYHRTGQQRRVKNRWITDAVYLEDVQCLVLSASDRSLTFYDAATLMHTPVYCITGLPNIATCMSYTSSVSSELALGTDRGDVIRIRFLQPRVSLFYTKEPDHINYYFWMELSSPPHSSYVCLHAWRRVHSRSIRRLAYLRDGQYIASCSHDTNVGVRLRHVMGKMDDYVFKVQRGVTCFQVVPSLHLLVTGGCDGVVRLWDTTQSAPFASLPVPALTAVLDVAVVAAKEIVIAYCNNCWLHIWDIYEELLLQTVKIKFPFLGVLGKKVEFGAYCIHPGPARKPAEDSDSDSDPLSAVLESSSRRASSVVQGSTGGLMIQNEEEERGSTGPMENDKEYTRFNRSELLLTCCDYVCVLLLGGAEGEGGPLPPPGDTLRARRPTYWDLPDDVFTAPKPPPSPAPNSSLDSLPPSYVPAGNHQGTRSAIPSSMLLSPSTAAYPQDLDTLLENAGLQGILEKDFVLMRGLKHDLNKKLADMRENIEVMTSAVTLGAPYLALTCIHPDTIAPGDDKMEEYTRVMKLFPERSLTGTPTISNISTPRKRGSTQ